MVGFLNFLHLCSGNSIFIIFLAILVPISHFRYNSKTKVFMVNEVEIAVYSYHIKDRVDVPAIATSVLEMERY